MSEMGPGCVKTCTSGECAELFSLFSSFDGDCQSGSFLIQRNRDKLSTRKFDVGVFTQPGSKKESASPPPAMRTSTVATETSVSCRFCCRSPLKASANNDSLTLTRSAAGMGHDGSVGAGSRAAVLFVLP